MLTIGSELPKEMARVREILGRYKEIGPAGEFGAFFIEQDLRSADEAIMSGDIIVMLGAYITLKEIKR